MVVITTFDLDEYVHGALKAGARGFLLKDAGPDLLAQASLMSKLHARNRIALAMWACETARINR